tara:strand:- start:28987 stop:29196 length:210 start_codon:yes stop_codon:yes gene_type:complete
MRLLFTFTLKIPYYNTEEGIGLSKRTKIIVIKDGHDKVMPIVDEATQEYFENIHQMLTDGFKDKCWKMI